MSTRTLAVIAGWVQFGLQSVNQISVSGPVHGWANWLTMIASLAAAIGIHAAAKSGPTA